MLKRIASWLSREPDRASSSQTGQSLRDALPTCAIPDDVRELGRHLLGYVLETFGGSDRVADIGGTVLAPHRVVFELFPFRLYVWLLGSLRADIEFQAALDRDSPAGGVIDAFHLDLHDRRYGFYVYSLEPGLDQERLSLAWKRIREGIGKPVRTAAIKEQHLAHHQPDAKPDDVQFETVSLHDDPDTVAHNLIRASLPGKFLDELSLDTDEGIAELMWLLLRRVGDASIEKDELIRFVQRNEGPLRARVAEMLPGMADAAKSTDENFGAMFEYFNQNVELALAGRYEEMDMRSDRLFWLIYALASQLDDEFISFGEARSRLARPQTAQRISEHQLLYMVADFGKALGSPHEASWTMIMLVAECAIIAGMPGTLRVTAELLAEDPSATHYSHLLDLLERSALFLESRHEDTSALRAALFRLKQRNTTVSEDDF